MLKIKLQPGGIVPKKTHIGDAGWDLLTPTEFTLESGDTATIDMKLQIQGEIGKYYRVDDKSSLATKGLRVSGGIIDNNYTGNIHVIISNFSVTPYTFPVGTKVAQLLVCPVEDDTDIEILNELIETTRGEGGFGSTGK